MLVGKGISKQKGGRWVRKGGGELDSKRGKKKEKQEKSSQHANIRDHHSTEPQHAHLGITGKRIGTGKEGEALDTYSILFFFLFFFFALFYTYKTDRMQRIFPHNTGFIVFLGWMVFAFEMAI